MGGSLLPTIVFKTMPPLLFLSISIVFNGITLALIPVFKNFILMNVAVALTGVTFGVVDMGVQEKLVLVILLQLIYLSYLRNILSYNINQNSKYRYKTYTVLNIISFPVIDTSEMGRRRKSCAHSVRFC